MPSAVSSVKAEWISVQVRMTLAEHQALQRLVHDIGHGSYQSYLRTLLVERLRDASALRLPRKPGNAV